VTHVVTADAVWRGLRFARGGNAFSATDIEEAFMSSADETKGRVKQAAGDLTGDKARDAVHRDSDTNELRC